MSAFGDLLRRSAAELSPVHLGAMLPRMLAAAVLGAALALRPWRLLLRRPLPRAEMMQTQILLCVAAAVITAVIGDSLAKAFGLVGLGSFVRFRSGLKDPRDAAILFLLIGLGMACGHGSLGLAFVGVGFVAALLFVLDLVDRSGPQIVTLSAETEDPAAAEAALRRALGEKNVVVRHSALDFPGKRLRLDLEGIDAGKVAQLLARSGEGPLRGLRWTLATRPAEREAREEI